MLCICGDGFATQRTFTRKVPFFVLVSTQSIMKLRTLIDDDNDGDYFICPM